MIASKKLTLQKAKPKRETENPAFIGAGLGGHAQYGMSRDNLALYSSWSWACIDKIAENLSSLDVSITTTKGRDKDVREDVPADHWLTKLIEDPNPEFEPSAIWSLAARWFLINGNAYLYTPTYGEKTPQEIWVLPSNRVSVIPGGKGDPLVKGYIYYHEGQRFGIDASEVIHWKFLDPSSDQNTSFFQGRSPINAAHRAIEVDFNNQEFQARYLRNDALPAFVVTTDEQFDPNKMEAFKALWNETFLGATKAGKWGMLHPGMDIKVLPSNGRLEEMTLLDDMNRRRVCAIWGVSEMILTGDFNARATSETVYSEFHRGTVAPKAKRLAEAITRHARRYEFDTGLSVKFLPYQYIDPAEQRAERESWNQMGVPVNTLLEEAGKEPLPAEEEPNELRSTVGGAAGLQALQIAYSMGQVSREAVLANAEIMYGFEPSEAARLFPQALPTPTPTETIQVEEEIAEEEVDEPAPQAKQYRSIRRTPTEEKEAVLYAYWKRYDTLAEKSADILKGQVAKGFKELEKAVLASIPEKGYTQKKESDTELFDIKEWEARFAELTSEEIARLLIRIAAEAMEDLGSNLDDYEDSFSKKSKDALTESTSKITTTVGTAHKELEELLKANRREPPEKVRELIQNKFNHYTKAGAERVARTTATFTTNRSQQDAWETLEEEDETIERIDRIWLTQGDGKVRPSHSAANGQVADKDGNFHVGGSTMSHPGAGGSGAEAVNCRCVTRPRIRRVKD